MGRRETSGLGSCSQNGPQRPAYVSGVSNRNSTYRRHPAIDAGR